jgi:hypothetical protein
MPPKVRRLSCRILLELEEFQRLTHIEKKYKVLLQQSKQPPAAKSDDLDGAGGSGDLEGAGGPGVWPGTEGVPTGRPAVGVNLNPSPPQENPCVQTARLFYDEDRNFKENKSRHAPAPLNDPLGVRDPDLPVGHAPVKPFIPTQKQRNEQLNEEDMEAASTSAGITHSSGDWPDWYCHGGSNTTTDDED